MVMLIYVCEASYKPVEPGYVVTAMVGEVPCARWKWGYIG